MLRRLLFVAALAATLFASRPAAAANAPAPLQNSIDIQLFQPGPGAYDLAGVQSARVGKHLNLNLGLFTNYAANELTVGSKTDGTTNLKLVKGRLNFDLLASLGIADFLEIGLAIPFTAVQATDPANPSFSGILPDTLPTSGMNDLRVVPKVQLYSNANFAVGAAATIWIPTGTKQGFMGEVGARAGGALLLEYRASMLRLLGNVGGRYRPAQTFLNLNTGGELTYGVGAELTPVEMGGMGLGAFASLQGAAGFRQSGSSGAPLEAYLGGTGTFGKDLQVNLGFGRGITTGYGTPDFRVFLGAKIGFDLGAASTPSAEPVVTPKIAANCTTGPEDMDGFEDDDGCADLDNDKDGIPDAQDMCPNEPETKNGFRDSDGCPDEAPSAFEAITAKLGSLEAPTDSDGDGVVDEADLCPKEKEDADGFQDTDGCPEADNDRDGIPDSADKCPNDAENINGVDDADGCPDVGEAKVTLKGDHLELAEKIQFVGQSEKVSPKSNALIGQIATHLKLRPALKLELLVHVDEPAKEDANLKLSQKRADTLKAMLVKEGAPEDRITATGKGNAEKLDAGKGKDAAEKNRRVELKITGGAK